MKRFRNLSPAVQVLSVLVAVAVVSVTWQVVVGHRFVLKDAYEDNDDRIAVISEFKKDWTRTIDEFCDEGAFSRSISGLTFHQSGDVDNYLLYLSNRKLDAKDSISPLWNVIIEVEPEDSSATSSDIQIVLYNDAGQDMRKSHDQDLDSLYEGLTSGLYAIQIEDFDKGRFSYDLKIRCIYAFEFPRPEVRIIPCDPLSWVPDGPEPDPFDSPFGYSISTLEGNLQIDAGRLAIGAEGVGLAFDEPVQHLRLDFSGEVDPGMSIRLFPADGTPFIEEPIDLNDSSSAEMSFDTKMSSAYIIPSEEGAYLRTVCFPFADFLE